MCWILDIYSFCVRTFRGFRLDIDTHFPSEITQQEPSQCKLLCFYGIPDLFRLAAEMPYVYLWRTKCCKLCPYLLGANVIVYVLLAVANQMNIKNSVYLLQDKNFNLLIITQNLLRKSMMYRVSQERPL